MNRTFLGALCATGTLIVHAQSWCPPGALWTHNYTDVMGNQFGVTRIVYEGDTLVGGFTAQKLRETNVTAPMGSSNYTSMSYPPMITRYADEVVYTWEGWNGTYDTLMWFGAAPGQYWSAPGAEDEPFYRMLVLDTATVELGGVPLRQLVVQFGQGGWMPVDTLRERLGFSYLYLNGWSWGATDMPWAGLRCYQDDEMVFEPNGPDACGYVLSIDPPEEEQSTLFPNPGTDRFTLATTVGSHRVALFDATGRCVHRVRAAGSGVTVATAHLAPGLYTVQVDDHAPLRWMKE